MRNRSIFIKVDITKGKIDRHTDRQTDTRTDRDVNALPWLRLSVVVGEEHDSEVETHRTQERDNRSHGNEADHRLFSCNRLVRTSETDYNQMNERSDSTVKQTARELGGR